MKKIFIKSGAVFLSSILVIIFIGKTVIEITFKK